MRHRLPSVSRRIALWLAAYAVALAAAALVHGILVNETAERLAWSSLLDAEMDHVVARSASDPQWRWTDTETLELRRFPLAALPADGLARFAPGLHDDIVHEGRELALQVRDVGSERIVLALDISDLEQRERELALAMAISALGLAVVMAIAAAFSARRLVQPLARLAERLQLLDPEQPLVEPLLPDPGSRELAVVARAAEDFLERSQRFIERERGFVDTASHELRTPVAVMAGAAELALAQPDVPPAVAQQLRRIRAEARSVERLVSLLLALARSPGRLREMADVVALDQLLPEIVEDHVHLCKGKELAVEVKPLARTQVSAPASIVQAAIGNLLRNAIENSDRGTVRVWLEPGPTVVIEDSGHGMTPEEVSRLYRALARGQSREGSGIGLALIARICEHLGWRLEMLQSDGGGTLARLRFDGGAA